MDISSHAQFSVQQLFKLAEVFPSKRSGLGVDKQQHFRTIRVSLAVSGQSPVESGFRSKLRKLSPMLENLPDYPQARHLAEALWRKEGQARGAALIVGAGVSTMAQIASEDTPKPPLWSDLAKSLRERLYPTNLDFAPSDSLRLAQEFQSYFGQAALNAHLREQIADSAWFPSPTHKRLLQLPWADVLTTNYDTLLERAAAEILAPAYDLVKSATDLVHARQPRIVKLHGSIGDDTPLVLTEEDYRTYPRRNAAMVNLARQVFIENELCLLGFSGADPNFMQWTGWVRDNLHGSHRKIYLVGVLHLSPPSRRLLEERNIAPIDLTPLVQGLPRSEQHAAATALLLEFLEQTKPTPAYEWKLDNQPINAFVQADTQDERDRLAALEKLRIRTERWHKERLQYPGWAVGPAKYRRRLAESCRSASQDMIRALDSLEGSEKASFLTEFVWRCRKAFCCPSDEQRQCLERFLQGDESVALSASQVDCGLLVLITYRESGNSTRFAALESRLQRAQLTPDQRSCLSYERALCARDLMRLEDLRTLLENVEGEDPMWKLRRAALACDLNMWDYARQQWLQANIDIRRREQADRHSIWVRSRRALLDFVSMGDRESRKNGSYAESRVRSIQDRISHCDPWEYVEEAREAIQRVHDARQKVRDETRQLAFSPGTFLNYHIYSAPIAGAREIRQGIQRWTDWAGIPSRFKEWSLPNLVTESLALAPEPSLLWMVQMVRGLYGSKDSYLNRNITRLTVAKLPKEVRDEAISALLNACEFWRMRIARESDVDAVRANQESLGKAMSVLARLIVAADAQTAQHSLEFAFNLAENNRDIEWRQYEALADLFEGSISALPLHNTALALRCASLPLASELSGKLMERLWPEPAQWLTRFDVDQGAKLSPVNTGRIEQLLGIAGMSGSARTDALTRLSALLSLGLLSPEQKITFGEALWSKRDEGTSQLPSESPFQIRALRDLPAPHSVDVVSLIRERLFTTNTRPNDETILEIVAIARGPNSVLPISTTAAEMFDHYLQPHPWVRMWLDGSPDEPPYLIRLRRDWLGLAIGRSLVPAMDASQLTTKRLNKLLERMDATGSASAVTALPHFAAAHPVEVGRLFYRVQVALLGAVSGDVAGGAEAVRIWLGNDNLRACLSTDQVFHLHELLFTALTAISSQSALEVVKTAHEVLAKNLDPANVGRLTNATQLLLKRTQPDHVQLGADGEAYFSLVRAEVLRMTKTLMDTGQVKGDELQAAIDESRADPLPEIRFAFAN